MPTTAMPMMPVHDPVDLLNPDMNGGEYRPVNLCPGLDFVFVTSGPDAVDRMDDRMDDRMVDRMGAPLDQTLRLFGDTELGDSAATGFSIEEVSDGGAVPFLKATNNTPFGVVLIAGQLVKGGKQNRGVSTDIFILSGQSAKIPVTCVEQGRWSGRPGARFQAAGVEPITIRVSKFRGVSDSRRERRSFEADQSSVWRDIDHMSHAVQARASGGDLLDSLEQFKGRRMSRNHHAPADTPAQSDGAEVQRLEEQIREVRQQARAVTERLDAALSHGDHVTVVTIRRSLDLMVQRLTQLERELTETRERLATPAGISSIDPARLAAADEAARGAIGLLVLFNGEFLAGDLFASPDWFAKFYGDLRDSALMSWDMVARRCATEGRAMDPAASAKAQSLARSVVNDALRGTWTDRPAAAHGRSQMLEHPYLESAMLADHNGTPLHVLLGCRQTPEILRAATQAAAPVHWRR